MMPAKATANKKASKEPRVSIEEKTITVKPAAGSLTLNDEPLNGAITRPATIPAIIPENNGAPEAKAIPRHNGNATKNTTRPAEKSYFKFDDKIVLFFIFHFLNNMAIIKSIFANHSKA